LIKECIANIECRLTDYFERLHPVNLSENPKCHSQQTGIIVYKLRSLTLTTKTDVPDHYPPELIDHLKFNSGFRGKFEATYMVMNFGNPS